MEDEVIKLTESQRNHLQTLLIGPFNPVGWLYRSIYRDLEAIGLVRETFDGDFLLTERGRKALEQR